MLTTVNSIGLALSPTELRQKRYLLFGEGESIQAPQASDLGWGNEAYTGWGRTLHETHLQAVTHKAFVLLAGHHRWLLAKVQGAVALRNDHAQLKSCQHAGTIKTSEQWIDPRALWMS